MEKNNNLNSLKQKKKAKNIIGKKESNLNKKDLKVAKIGYALSIIAFIGTLYSLIFSLSFLITVAYYFVLIIILILSLLTLLLSDKFREYLAAGEKINEVANALSNSVIYVLPLALVIGIISFQILVSKKGYIQRTSGLVFSIISILLCIIIYAGRIFIPQILS